MMKINQELNPQKRGNICKNLNTNLSRLTILVVLIAIVVSIIVGVSMLSIKTPSGLPSSHREEEASYEKFQKSFLDNVSAKEIKETMKFYSSKSHIAGSPSDYEQALETKKRY